jgi:putative ABC transport system substrate-binding protein
LLIKALLLTASLAAGLAGSAGALAQQGKVWHVGFLMAAGPEGSAGLLVAFRDSMRKLGYVEGKNLVIEHRWPKTTFAAEPDVAAGLVQSKVDAIVAWPTPGALAAKAATTTIPIVFFGVADPVGSGIVRSLARPGGNITGISNLALDLAAKQVQLLMQLLPGIKRVGIVVNTGNPGVNLQLGETQRAMQEMGLQSLVIHARASDEFESAFRRLSAERVTAVLIVPDSSTLEHRNAIAALALKARLPTVFQREENVEAGGLISYGTSLTEQVRQGARYVDRIFKGAKPADLPVEQPERIKLVINLKTAQALAIKVPSELLVRADAVVR